MLEDTLWERAFLPSQKKNKKYINPCHHSQDKIIRTRCREGNTGNARDGCREISIEAFTACAFRFEARYRKNLERVMNTRDVRVLVSVTGGEKPNHATRDQKRGRGEHHVPAGEGHGVLEVVIGEQRLVEEDNAYGAEYRRQHPDGNLRAEACHLSGRPRRAHDDECFVC